MYHHHRCKRRRSNIRHDFFSWLATNVRVVRTGVPMTNRGRRNHALIRIPFLLIILGTVGLGGLNAARAYRKQKEAYPSHNPFLP
ncbi:hypothetical protein Pint_00778 [Pistacia integerrima]|uniref:Uncharacterized protein n=1 Tax=Pistacia integerrima TaxID=434235 RepID=A0ACC0ZS79_9ROSI|nr:hypothetical protein Pint_00778 [Pistacia integerrima]